MNDIEEIYQCLLDKSYQDAVQLDIVVSKVTDQDLVLGFLFDLVMRHEEYGSDQETVKLAIANITDPDTLDAKHVSDCHTKYIQTMKSKNDASMADNVFSIATLFLLLDEKIDEYEETVANCDSVSSLEALKGHLLEGEQYEYIAVIDNRIKQIRDGRG